MAECAARFHQERLHRCPDDYPLQIRSLIEEGMALDVVDCISALSLRDKLRKRVGRLLEKERFIITPATTDFAPSPETTGSPLFNTPWSFVGTPTVSVPAGGSDDGLPHALQFTGRHEKEDSLLAVARWAEHSLKFEPKLPAKP